MRPKAHDTLGHGEDFLRQLAQQRVSEHTLRAYRADLDALLRWLHEQGADTARLDRALVRDYVGELAMSGAAPATVARKVSSLRALCAYLAAEGVIDGQTTTGLKCPERHQKLPEILSAAEAERLLSAAASMPSRFPSDFGSDFRSEFPAEIRLEMCQRMRDRLLLELLYGCGLRSAEAVRLDLDDVRPDEGTLIVHGKGNKTRIVPFGSQVRSALDAWLTLRPEAESKRLLLSLHRKPLSTADVRRIVAAAGSRVGLRVHPHMLRHACATHMLEGGADIRTIQEFLGHANIATTTVYTHVSESHMRAVYSTAHPRA